MDLLRQAFLPKKDDLQGRMEYVDGTQRVRSTSLLFVGSLLGFLGFCFAAFLGFWQQIMEVPHLNFRHEPMGTYFPATVSEMVYDSQSGAGKCFFAFVLIGGICMLLSWYPWALRNVYIGDDAMLLENWLGNDRSDRPRGIKVLMLRQFLPPIGIMLVACIPAPPAANREFTDTVSSLVHTLGAVMSIGGYAAIELATLHYKPWHSSRKGGHGVVFDTKINGKNISVNERTTRTILIGLCLFSIVAFQVSGFLYGKADKLGFCCNDVWAVPNATDWSGLNGDKTIGLRIEDEIAAAHGKKLLLSTATGFDKILKLSEYWFEVFAGLFMLASHLAIWFYCPERFVDLAESLPDCVPEGDCCRRA